MEDYKWIIITVIAYLAALFYDLRKRDEDSKFSPKRFDPLFYLQDNWARLLVSLFFSCLLAWLFFMVAPQLAIMGDELSLWGTLVYVLIGAAPDLFISYAKRKTNFLRPEQVSGFDRRSITPPPGKPPKGNEPDDDND